MKIWRSPRHVVEAEDLHRAQAHHGVHDRHGRDERSAGVRDVPGALKTGRRERDGTTGAGHGERRCERRGAEREHSGRSEELSLHGDRTKRNQGHHERPVAAEPSGVQLVTPPHSATFLKQSWNPDVAAQSYARSAKARTLLLRRVHERASATPLLRAGQAEFAFGRVPCSRREHRCEARSPPFGIATVRATFGVVHPGDERRERDAHPAPEHREGPRPNVRRARSIETRSINAGSSRTHAASAWSRKRERAACLPVDHPAVAHVRGHADRTSSTRCGTTRRNGA